MIPSLRGPALVVEDEPGVADLITGMLKAIGHPDVRRAETIDEALRLIEASRPALAVLDVNLRGAPAHPVAIRLKALDVPFVVATGFDTRRLPSSFAAAAVVLRKPFSRSDLEKALEQALKDRPA